MINIQHSHDVSTSMCVRMHVLEQMGVEHINKYTYRFCVDISSHSVRQHQLVSEVLGFTVNPFSKAETQRILHTQRTYILNIESKVNNL